MEAISTYSVTHNPMNMGLFQICVLPWPSEDQLRWKSDFPAASPWVTTRWRRLTRGTTTRRSRCTSRPGPWTSSSLAGLQEDLEPWNHLHSRNYRRSRQLQHLHLDQVLDKTLCGTVGGGGLKTIEYQVWFGLLGMDWRDPMVHLLECNVSKHHTIEHNVNNGTQWHTYWNVM